MWEIASNLKKRDRRKDERTERKEGGRGCATYQHTILFSALAKEKGVTTYCLCCSTFMFTALISGFSSLNKRCYYTRHRNNHRPMSKEPKWNQGRPSEIESRSRINCSIYFFLFLLEFQGNFCLWRAVNHLFTTASKGLQIFKVKVGL